MIARRDIGILNNYRVSSRENTGAFWLSYHKDHLFSSCMDVETKMPGRGTTVIDHGPLGGVLHVNEKWIQASATRFSRNRENPNRMNAITMETSDRTRTPFE